MLLFFLPVLSFYSYLKSVHLVSQPLFCNHFRPERPSSKSALKILEAKLFGTPLIECDLAQIDFCPGC